MSVGVSTWARYPMYRVWILEDSAVNCPSCIGTQMTWMAVFRKDCVQGYLAYQKQRPPRTPQ